MAQLDLERNELWEEEGLEPEDFLEVVCPHALGCTAQLFEHAKPART